MSADETVKPLHVRVAEALGWGGPFQRGGGTMLATDNHWDGRAPGNYVIGEQHDRIPRYDTDWSATGPLIERYRILLVTAPDWGDWTARAHDSLLQARAATPLIAVCNLIIALAAAGKLERE